MPEAKAYYKIDDIAQSLKEDQNFSTAIRKEIR
jgi:hypothetical protein